ncbi:MAG: ATP-binding cassette domain-containing protein [Aphanocapsa sp. GSE-SYN-MK-11-07L]|jgi:lipopolysaccharide transport system ATP-binding protein|nr:ATP-binding cassette domain-containing protein [Aphanocapsa sp. GSE-SYN-MK-11-07L]
MSETVIRVSNLGKKYVIGHQQQGRSQHTTLRDTITNSIKSFGSNLLTRKEKDTLSSNQEEFWALKDVSFEVKQGEVVGIIGRNGAGKSTLLKILSQITEPTTGEIEITGRVASLLEVGTGFHPELTGRENIFLNGAILGMSRVEIRKKFDEIVDFAEVERFLDTPVKHYSSGMYVRLAFAVAAHLEPEILIVDEVLAVGDIGFQKKCLGKMGDVATKEGKTILFVSHNMEAVARLCNQAILFKQGYLNTFDDVNRVLNQYLQRNIELSPQKRWKNHDAPGNTIVKLIEIKAHGQDGTVVQNYIISKPIYITIVYEVMKPGYILTAGLNFFNEQDINLFDLHDTNQDWRRKTKSPGIYRSTVKILDNFLTEGLITVCVAIITPDPFFIHLHEKDVIIINIIDDLAEISARGDFIGHFPGVVRPLMKWETYQIDNKTSLN